MHQPGSAGMWGTETLHLTTHQGDVLSDMLDQASQDLEKMNSGFEQKRHYQDEGNIRPSGRAVRDCAIADARNHIRQGGPVNVMPGRGDKAHFGVCVDAKSCLQIDQLPHKRHTLSQPAGSAPDFPHAKGHFDGLAQRQHTPAWDSMGPTQPGFNSPARGALDNPSHGEAEHYGDALYGGGKKHCERKHYGRGDNHYVTAMYENKDHILT